MSIQPNTHRRSAEVGPGDGERPGGLGTIGCRDVRELLPWLINGSLADSEGHALRAHLAACASCRRELGDTAEVWQLSTWHIPSLALAEYAHGLAPEALDRELIERHLALCPSCQRELEQAVPERVVDLEAVREERALRSRWNPAAVGSSIVTHGRLLAAAASLAFVLLSGVAIWSLTGRDLAPVETAVAARVAEPGTAEGRRVAAQGGAGIFADGFESGHSARWSASE